MKLGLLADVHENLVFLNRALDRLQQQQVGQIIFLGDLVDRGDQFQEAGARLAEVGAIGVWGNHEFGLCHQPSEDIRARYAGPGFDFLLSLQPALEIADVRICHFLPHHEPTDITQPWYTEDVPEAPDVLSRIFAATPHRVMFGGHLHRWLALTPEGAVPWEGTEPIRLTPPGRWFVVIHAVCQGWCATYDTESHVLTPIRVRGLSSTVNSESPAALLDQIRSHPQWSPRECESVLDQIVSRHDPERIEECLALRWSDLSGSHGEVVLRLTNAFVPPEQRAGLAQALAGQIDRLSPERLWEALSLLEGTEWLDAYPVLRKQLNELDELLDEEDTSFEELADQFEDDPDGVTAALQGLATVEPEVRAEIIGSLAEQPARPGLIEFLRVLAQSPEPTTAKAARKGLESLKLDERHTTTGSASGQSTGNAFALVTPGSPPLPSRAADGEPGRDLVPPSWRASLVGIRVTPLDARGCGVIGIAVQQEGSATAAAFLCDIAEGIVDVLGIQGVSEEEAREFLDETLGERGISGVAEAPETALALLAASLLSCGPTTPPVLPYWLERTVGPHFHPRSFILDDAPEPIPPEQIHEWSLTVLDACPGWVDNSDLTYEIAEELLLREGGSEPDPKRDSGAFRFLFEGRMKTQLEHDRRLLAWMAAVWTATSKNELARAAVTLAWQLADAQHVVPGHPYIVELTRRSLRAAQRDLCRGNDLRDPLTRARRARIGW